MNALAEAKQNHFSKVLYASEDEVPERTSNGATYVIEQSGDTVRLNSNILFAITQWRDPKSESAVPGNRRCAKRARMMPRIECKLR